MSITWKTAAVRPLVGVVAGLVALTGCATAGGGSSKSDEVSVVGFSILKTANEQLLKDFQKTDAGKGVTFKTSYGASGDQSRAVIAGLDADEVHLSLEPDVTKLVDEKLVADDWKSGPNKGVVTQSVVAIVVRKGNPKGIKGWDDLVKPGVKLITPNPASSGSARWNILAAYQQVIASGGSEADAKAYLTKLFNNVVALPGSGRDATNAFLEGSGNVLISYENEAILARQSGEDFDYIVPNATLKIENPGAVLKDADPKAKAYLDFVLNTAGQEEFVKKGFRPVVKDTPVSTVEGANDPTKPFPVPSKLFTIADLGGWDAVNTKFFEENTGIVPQIQKATGKSQ